MLVAEEMHIWRASCSSRMATPRSESWYRQWPATRDLDMVVHGDDFIVVGDASWCRKPDWDLSYDSEATVFEPLCNVQRLWTHVGS